MATDLAATEEFPAVPAEVFALFTTEDFLTGRMTASGGIDPKVVQVEAEGDLTTIVTQQSIPADALPSVVSSMLGGDPVTERKELWRADGDGYAADWTLIVKGAPATVAGTMTLAPGGQGSVLSVTGSANVPIPLFGAKLESTIVEQITAVLAAEGDYTRERLA